MSGYDYEEGKDTIQKEFLSRNAISNKSINDSSFDDLFSPIDAYSIATKQLADSSFDDLFLINENYQFSSFSFSNQPLFTKNQNPCDSKQLDELHNLLIEQLNRPKLSDIFANPKLVSEAEFNMILDEISKTLTFSHPELTLQDKNDLETIINDLFPKNSLSTPIIFDTSINCRPSRHDTSKVVYTVFSQSSFLDSGANGSIKKPVAEFKLDNNNNWVIKSYNENNLNKVFKEISSLKKHNDKTLHERLSEINKLIHDLENETNNPVKAYQILSDIYTKIDSYKKHKKLLSSLENEFENAKKCFSNQPDNNKSFHLLPSLGLMAMPYKRGITLEKIILRDSYTMEERIEILKNLFDAIQELHEKNMVHNDLRPANVLVKNDKSTVIVDFGLAVDCGKQHNGNFNLVCAAPEVYNPKYSQNKKMDSLSTHPAQDIFSFGLIVRMMLYGTRNRVWKIEEIANVNNNDNLIIEDSDQYSVSSIADEELNKIYSQLQKLKEEIALLSNNENCDNANHPLRYDSPDVETKIEEPYKLEVPNATAMLLNVDSNKRSTESIFISVSKPNAPVKITGIQLDGSLLDNTSFSDTVRTMIEELDQGLLAIDPDQRFSHQQVKEKFNAISEAILAEKLTNAVVPTPSAG